jgi:hypothetical protein
MKARIPLIAALAVAVLPAKASAQAWVSNPDFSDGVGIRAGDLELHPSLGGEFGYDSNYFRAAPSEGIVDVLRLRITPSIRLSTLGARRRASDVPPSLTFVAGAHAAYNEIIPLSSADSDVSKQRNVALGADARLDAFPQGKLGFDLYGAFRRYIEPAGDTDDLVRSAFNRDVVRAGTGVSWRPGGGLFDWRFGYGLVYNVFEDSRFSSFGNVQHDLGTRGRWRFLPRSALMFDSTYSMLRYTSSAAQQTNGDVVRSRVGFRGLVTYHLALLGMLGWGASFYETRNSAGGLVAQQFDSLLANAEVRWFVIPRPTLEEASITSGLSSVALGYARTFENSYLGSYYQRDRGYLQFSAFLVGRVVSGLEFGVSRLAFPASQFSAPFTQMRLDGRAFGEYRITDNFATNLTLLYDKVTGTPRINGEALNYSRFQIYLGARLFW